MRLAPLSPELIAAFEKQTQAASHLGSPFTALLCRTIVEYGLPSSDTRTRMVRWEGDVTAAGDALPVRFCAALHELVLSGADADLAAVYPPNQAGLTTAALSRAVGHIVTRQDEFIANRLESPPQTNEIRRSSAVYAGLLHIAGRTGLPLRLSEIGASAGLNLLLDRFRHDLTHAVHGPADSTVRLKPDWRGMAPVSSNVSIAERRGCDLAPFDLSLSEHRTRLMSYVWADQADRLERLRAALAIAAGAPVTVDRSDALAWLETRLAAPQLGTAHVLYHTIAWQYLSKDARDRGREIIRAAGEKTTADTPLFRLGMEPDGHSPGALLQLEAWPSGETTALARVDFHGRWIEWR